MRSPLLLALGLSLASAAGAAAGDDATAPPPKDSYVKVRVEVEVRGVLRQTDKGFTVSSRFKVYQLFHPDKVIPETSGERPADVYDLDFARAADLRELAEALKGKEEVVAGMSELRMVEHPRRPGAGSGLGPPAPFPVPTWGLERTILVTGLKSARMARVAPAAEPKADGDREAGATYDSPQAVFDAAVDAEKKGDPRTWVGCLTPETRKEYAGKLAYVAVGYQHLIHDNPRLREAGQFRPLLVVLDKHGLTYDVTKKIRTDLDAEERCKAVAELAALIKDPTALTADLVEAYSTGELSHFKPKDLIRLEYLLEPLRDLPEPKLVDLHVDGARAAGFLSSRINGTEMKRPMAFVKVGGGWRIAAEPRP